MCFLLYLDISLSNVQNFIEECIITSKLDHPNVLSLIGVSINPVDATLHMVMLFMDHGDVKSFLKSKRGDKIEFDNFPEVRICYIRMYKHMYCMYIINFIAVLSYVYRMSSYIW